MDSPAYFIGRLLAVLLFASPALYFLRQGLKLGPRSLKLANFALFCGLATFVAPEVALGLTTVGQPDLSLAAGIVRSLLGLIGIVLALLAFSSISDGGVSWARPATAVCFCLIHLMVGAGLLASSWFMSHAGTPWVYESPDGDYRLTMPSQHWKQAPTTEGSADVAFVRSGPQMQAAVKVMRQQTQDDFAWAPDRFQDKWVTHPQLRGQAKFREGINAANNSYRYCTAMDSSPDGKPVFVAHVFVWCPAKQLVIEVIVEGLPSMLSKTGQAAEMAIFEKSAETICLSVE
jgi:hypothetical protein